MRRLRGLVVDDTAGNAYVIEQALDLDLDTYGCQVEWTFCRDVPSARSTVRMADTFDFAIVDLIIGAGQDGLTVVRELRAKDDRTFVLLVTSYPAEWPGFVESAADAGANHALIRQQLVDGSSGWSFDRLAGRIRKHVFATGLVAHRGLEYDKEDVNLVSALDAMGGGGHDAVERALRAVRSLALTALDPRYADASLQLTHLASGRSGATLCRLDVAVPEQPPESFVLRLGPNRPAVTRPARGAHEAAEVLGDAVATVIDAPGAAGGTGVALARVPHGALLLGPWLATEASAAQAREAVTVLIQERLRPLVEPAHRRHRPAADWFRASVGQRARVHQALALHRAALADPKAGNRPGTADIVRFLEQFVDAGTLPGRSGEPPLPEVVYVAGIGDLRAANVVVVPGGPTGRLTVLDTSRFGTYHWSQDPARLVVDLLLCWRRPAADAMLWTDFAEMLHVAKRLCPVYATRHPVLDPEHPVDAAIDGLLHHLPLGSPLLDRHWEWHTGLAMEFLRQACERDLTPARSALALAAAAGHLRAAGKLTLPPIT